MTTQTQNSSPLIRYTAVNPQVLFDIPFDMTSSNDLRVFINTTELTCNIDYTVLGTTAELRSGDGQIMLQVTYTDNDTLLLLRDSTNTRVTDFEQAARFQAGELDSEFNNLLRQVEDAELFTTSAPHLAPSDIGIIDGQLPPAEPNGVISVNEDGTGFVYAQGINISSAQIKERYESNPNTNPLTDAEKALLGRINEAGILDSAEIKTLYEANINTNAFTDADRNNLSDLVGRPELFFGEFNSLTALLAATPEFDFNDNPYRGEDGAYATVTTQPGELDLYLNNEGTWVRVGGLTPSQTNKLDSIETGAEVNHTAFEIKNLYESVTNTNAYTDSERNKLAGIEISADVNQTDAEIKAQYERNTDTNAFTDAEKDKLAALEGSLFAGVFPSEEALIDGTDANSAGSYAFVDAGDNSPTMLYLYDIDEDGSDGTWVNNGATSAETASSIKTKYESNPDTNAFTDAEQAKLANLPDTIGGAVQSNWDETNTENASFILNKPDIITVVRAGSGIDVREANGVVTVTGEQGTTTNIGDVRLATLTETAQGTSQGLAVTPAGVSSEITTAIANLPVPATAGRWSSSRRITLSGDATGIVDIRGDADVTLPVVVSDNSHRHTIENITGLQNALITAEERDKLENYPDSVSDLYSHDTSRSTTSFGISFTQDEGDQEINIPLATNTQAGLLSPAEKMAIANGGNGGGGGGFAPQRFVYQAGSHIFNPPEGTTTMKVTAISGGGGGASGEGVNGARGGATSISNLVTIVGGSGGSSLSATNSRPTFNSLIPIDQRGFLYQVGSTTGRGGASFLSDRNLTARRLSSDGSRFIRGDRGILGEGGTGGPNTQGSASRGRGGNSGTTCIIYTDTILSGYAITVGAGGNGGAGNQSPGGNGGGGIVIVEVF